jgi:nicotinate phosphoribosyltransferase
VFADEPLIRVQADLIEAQILETYLLTCLNLQTLVATKAARVNLAAQGRPVVDFGTRRAHGPQAGLLAARAAIIGGCAGTSNVHAATALGVPAVGTMAHSWVMAFDNETEAFRHFGDTFPDSTICLVDTYDTVQGAAAAAHALGSSLQGVRLDSGNLLDLSRQVRRVLDDHGCTHARIVASSDLNEFAIRELLAANAPIDSFGVVTDMVTSRDAPALSLVYKLVATRQPNDRWRALVKRSRDKSTLGGPKQVWRRYGPDGRISHDVLGLADEEQDGQPLLKQYIARGRLIEHPPPVTRIADRARREVHNLPPAARELRGGYDHPIQVSAALQAAQPR